MAKIRVTNNSEVDPSDIVSVELTGDGYRVGFKNEQATRYRAVQLTDAGRKMLEEHPTKCTCFEWGYGKARCPVPGHKER